MKSLITALSCMALLACSDSAGSDFQTPGVYEVEAADYLLIKSSDLKSRWKNHQHEIWEFRNTRGMLRVSGRFEESVVGTEYEAMDLIANNVYLEIKHPIDGKITSVSCHPNRDEPVGNLIRIINSDDTSSGTFEVMFERCRETYTGQEITAIKLPLQVKGIFDGLGLK